MHPHLRRRPAQWFAARPTSGSQPSPASTAAVPRCNKCNQLGHKFNQCPNAAIINSLLRRVQAGGRGQHQATRQGSATRQASRSPRRASSAASLGVVTYADLLRQAPPAAGMEVDENEEAPEYNDDKGKRPVASVIQLESEEEELFEDAQEYDDEWTAAETAEFDAAIDDTLEGVCLR